MCATFPSWCPVHFKRKWLLRLNQNGNGWLAESASSQPYSWLPELGRSQIALHKIQELGLSLADEQDPFFKEVFYLQILPELKRRGSAVICITHDDKYFPVADRVIKLDCGKEEIIYDN